MRLLDSESLTRALKSRQVSEVTVDSPRQLTIQFIDGTLLIVEADAEGICAYVESKTKSAARRLSNYIAKCTQRFGRARASLSGLCPERAAQASQSQPVELEDAFDMREQHLDR